VVLQIACTLVVAASTPPGDGFMTDPVRLKANAVGELVGQLGDPKKGRDAARRLARFGRLAVKPTIEALASKKLQVRFYAATVLDIIGDEAGAKALLGVLENNNEDLMVRLIAARAMGRACYSPAVDTLLRLARAHARGVEPKADPATDARPSPGRKGTDPGPEEEDVLAGNEEFRFEVIRALAYMDVVEADELLTSALSDPSARIRRVAAEGLGDHRVVTALGALRGLLEDPDGATAAAAAKAIGKMGKRGAAAVPDLVKALERGDFRVRRAVIGALALTTGRSHRTPERWRRWWKERSNPRSAPAEEKARDGFPLPAVLATEIFRQRETDPRRPEPPSGAPGSRRDVPPALRMPWETGPDDDEQTPASTD